MQLSVRFLNVPRSDALVAAAERGAKHSLTRVAGEVESVVVRFEQAGAPAGQSQICHVVATGRFRRVVASRACAKDLPSAVSSAFACLERCILRALRSEHRFARTRAARREKRESLVGVMAAPTA